MRTWMITGASGGLGKAFALAALQAGDKVALTSRRRENLRGFCDSYPGRVLPLEVQLAGAGEIQAAFDEAVKAFGHVDVVVNNAGYIHLGALEETSEQEARDEMEVLFWAPYHLTKAAVAHMRPRGRGTIVQVSSLAGIGGLPGNTMYAAAKYALEGMSEALSREVARFGIKVLLLEPAGIRTKIGGSVAMAKPMPEYEPVLGPQRKRFAAGDDNTAKGSAEKCAAALLQLLEMENPPLRFLMSDFATHTGQQIHRERLQEAQEFEALSRGISEP